MSFNNSAYNGIYKMILLLPFPERNDSITAVSITMIAHEYSEIKTLEDLDPELASRLVSLDSAARTAIKDILASTDEPKVNKGGRPRKKVLGGN